MQLKMRIDTNSIKKNLNTLQKQTEETQPLMAEIGEIVKRSIDKNFREGGRATPWVPSRRALKQGGKTLIDSGRLRSSITAFATQSSVRIGTNVKYAPYLHFGTHSQGLKRKLYKKRGGKREESHAISRTNAKCNR